MQVRDPSPDVHIGFAIKKKCDGPTESEKRRELVDRAGPATCEWATPRASLSLSPTQGLQPGMGSLEK